MGSGVSYVDALCAGIVDGARSVGGYYNWNTGDQLFPDIDVDQFDNTQGFGIQISNHSYRFKIEQLKTEENDSLNIDLDFDFEFQNPKSCILDFDFGNNEKTKIQNPALWILTLKTMKNPKSKILSSRF